ncbi:MAG: class I SAM-dependent methyltransferase [Planctomycetota bacterium]|jgi:SAM-dependent methyltransferase
MDDATLRYYEATMGKHYEGMETFRNPELARLAPLLAPGARVVDVGSGSGRDMAHLLADGFDAVGIEPTAAFREVAVKLHPELEGRVHAGVLPDGLPDPEEVGAPFDALLCTAVLQHLPRERLGEAAAALAGLVKGGGHGLVAVPSERPGLDDEERDGAGRLFTMFDPGELQGAFEGEGWVFVERWNEADVLGRDGHRWWVMVFSRAG